MAAIRKRWQLGSEITGKAITGQDLNLDGTFTAGAALSLDNVLERFGFSFTNRTEEIGPMDSNRDNQVIVLRSNSVTLEEIIQGGIQPRLEVVASAFDHASFTYTEYGKVKTIFGVILSGGEDKVRGKNVYRLELGPIEMSVGTGDNVTIEDAS